MTYELWASLYFEKKIGIFFLLLGKASSGWIFVHQVIDRGGGYHLSTFGSAWSRDLVDDGEGFLCFVILRCELMVGEVKNQGRVCMINLTFGSRWVHFCTQFVVWFCFQLSKGEMGGGWNLWFSCLCCTFLDFGIRIQKEEF